MPKQQARDDLALDGPRQDQARIVGDIGSGQIGYRLRDREAGRRENMIQIGPVRHVVDHASPQMCRRETVPAERQPGRSPRSRAKCATNRRLSTEAILDLTASLAIPAFRFIAF